MQLGPDSVLLPDSLAKYVNDEAELKKDIILLLLAGSFFTRDDKILDAQAQSIHEKTSRVYVTREGE